MLSPGTRLGPYEILSPLGAGGMGEVYRARDTKLGRDVALKTLSAAFATDPERLARFEREARALAALNHPHIAQIYGFEQSVLVMELVEGEDLAHRLKRGPIPSDETILIARQIVDALEAAHEQGIVHRDLKPANIKVRPDGTVKVLDFGLAKALDQGSGRGPQTPGEMLNSPTITSPAAMTMGGMILGTAAYMAPEQARGKSVDKRADIWAFGCVLFEMLTGRNVFSGETVTDVIAAVVNREPDFALLPATTTPSVRRLLSRCLQKDPKRRLRDIGDARLDLEDQSEGATRVEPSARRSSPMWLAGALMAGALAGGLVVWMARPSSAPEQLRQLEIVPQIEEILLLEDRPQLSPAGDQMLIPGGPRLHVRHLSETAERALAATEGAQFVGWSPDGAEIAWVARRRVWRMPITGGRPTAIATVAATLAGAGALVWLRDGRIVLAGSSEALLLEVPAGGGSVRTVLALTSERDRDLHDVALLPDEQTLIAVWHMQGEAPDRLGIIDLAAGTISEVARFAGERLGYVAWSPTGHILLERTTPDLAIWALPFDAKARRATGEAFLVVAGGGMPSVARDGTLAYLRGGRKPWRQLVWVERDGRIAATVGRPQAMLHHPALDRSGTRALAVADPPNDNVSELWMWDTATGMRTRLSDNPNFDANPSWMPDGRSIIWAQGDRDAVVLRGAAVTGEPQTIATGRQPHPSPSTQTFVATTIGPTGSFDISVGAIEQPAMKALIATNADETNARISPDGQLIAYVSNESGDDEVFVDAFPGLGNRQQVSSGGGYSPRWGVRGVLHYLADGRMMAVEIRGNPPTLGGRPTTLFTLAESGLSVVIDSFDIDSAGRFLMLRNTPRPEGPAQITVVTGTLPVLASGNRQPGSR